MPINTIYKNIYFHFVINHSDFYSSGHVLYLIFILYFVQIYLLECNFEYRKLWSKQFEIYNSVMFSQTKYIIYRCFVLAFLWTLLIYFFITITSEKFVFICLFRFFIVEFIMNLEFCNYITVIFFKYSINIIHAIFENYLIPIPEKTYFKRNIILTT